MEHPSKLACFALLAALVFMLLAKGASAYYYNTFTDCGTGLGANGTTVSCESPPLLIPQDCSFATGTDLGGDRINLHQYGSFQGACDGDYQYVRAYLPDTTLKYQNVLLCSQTPWIADFYTPRDSILSGYGVCIPSVGIQCAMHSRLNLGCWRNSTELLINRGFETTYTTALDTGALGNVSNAAPHTYVTNWALPDSSAFNNYVSSDSWWGRTGSQYLFVTTNGTGVTKNMTLTQEVYIPPDLGGLYNISYNMNLTVEIQQWCLPVATSYLVFPDATTFALQSLSYPYPLMPDGCVQFTSCPVYNGTFSQTVNVGAKTGYAHLYFRITCASPVDSSWWLDEFRLDNVSVTSECVGTSPNCTLELQAPPAPTTTTIPTNVTIPPEIEPVGNALQYAADAISSLFAYTLRTDMTGGKLVLWVTVSLLVSIGAVKYISNSVSVPAWEMFAAVMLVMMLVGIVVGYVYIPLWVGILIVLAIIVAAGSTIAKYSTGGR